MTTAGWIIMILSVGAVLSLVVFCLYRVLTMTPEQSDEYDPPRSLSM